MKILQESIESSKAVSHIARMSVNLIQAKIYIQQNLNEDLNMVISLCQK